MDLPENKLADLIKDNEKAMWRPVNNHNIIQFTQDDILRITKNHGTLIGKGGFGEVYQGVLDNGSLVVVKKYIQKNYNEGFAKELIVHSHINHKSVVRLLGYCGEENALMVVTEIISKGNLSELLHISRDPISLATRLSIAMECAEALNYMHSMYQPIIHGDIKPENILLDDELGAKLADFGISRLLSMDRTQYTKNVIGSIGYVDPEFILKGRINPKNDVCSFGVVLLELITRKRICENGRCTDLTENFMKAFGKGKKVRDMLDSEIVNADRKILNKVGKLINDCLKMNFNERPDMKDVVQHLQMLTKSYYEQGKEKTTQWSLRGEQKINQDNIATSNSHSTLLYKVGSLDIFNRTARSKVIRNVSPTLVLFKMEDLRPIFKSGLLFGRDYYFELYNGCLHGK
ncbi:wall-associated receptor kinase 4-like [Miscanthus floridulus]|uniref:wall-associated receptor kinase 4-like n=1 Tax=Miscanthus floridulus TaxID=154761 RepID=UPI003458464A